MSLHSPIGASGRYRWKRCPGSVRLSKLVGPSLSSVYAEEGTRAHEYAARWLRDGIVPDDPEMRQHLQVYIDAIRAYLPLTGTGGTVLLVEHRFNLTHLHPDAFGTADCVIYIPSLKLLIVIDLKYGAGVLYELPSEQNEYYGLGALRTRFPEAERVKMVIVQPRMEHPDGPVREIEIPASDFDTIEFDIGMEMAATDAPDAPLVPGKHCKWCPAAGICPEVDKTATAVVVNPEYQLSPQNVYDPEKLSRAIDLVPMIRAWCKDVMQFAAQELARGREIPGFKLVAKRASRHIAVGMDADDAAMLINAATGLAPNRCFDVPKLKSVKQIEDQLSPAGKKAFESLWLKQSSGVKIAPASSALPAVTGVDPKAVFTVYEDEEGE